MASRTLKDARNAFVEACRLYYDTLKRTSPAVLELKESMLARFDEIDADRRVRERSKVQRLMRRLKAALGDVPAATERAVRRVLIEEIMKDAA